MSAFAPTDPRDLMNRRKQLVQKLAQQYQQKAGGSGGANVPAIGGRPFHGAVGNRAYAHPGITNASNVISSLLSRLGPGGAGLPLPGEISPGPGMAAPNSTPAPPHPQAPAPPAPVGAPPPPAAAPAPVDPGFNLGGAPSAPLPAAGNILAGGTGPAASRSTLIPLGGGAYYDYSTDTVHGTGGFG